MITRFGKIRNKELTTGTLPIFLPIIGGNMKESKLWVQKHIASGVYTPYRLHRELYVRPGYEVHGPFNDLNEVRKFIREQGRTKP
jgi:hypothetical protein